MITISVENPIGQPQIKLLRSILGGGPVLIATHSNPDPDALASGKAISHLLHTKWKIPTQLIYDGLVGRAENRAALKLLTPEWVHIDQMTEWPTYSALILVDCQPGLRTPIPFEENTPFIVIDHHYPILEKTKRAAYADVRPNVGSTVTMVYQYLDAAQVCIDPVLATAMFLGLRTDTNGLCRGSTLEDGIVYVKLLERLDQKLQLKIEEAGLSLEYYQAFFRGMRNARVYGKAIVAFLGNMHRPDISAELADLLFRFENVHAALCSGIYKGVLHFSIRTDLMEQDAGLLVKRVVFPPGNAGGHGIIAGGQVPLGGEDVGPVVTKLEGRFLECVGERNVSRSFLPD